MIRAAQACTAHGGKCLRQGVWQYDLVDMHCSGWEVFETWCLAVQSGRFALLRKCLRLGVWSYNLLKMLRLLLRMVELEDG